MEILIVGLAEFVSLKNWFSFLPIVQSDCIPLGYIYVCNFDMHLEN